MVYNSSDYNYDFVVPEIQKAPLNVMFFRQDRPNTVLSFLESNSVYNETQRISGAGQTITVYLVPTKYNDEQWDTTVDCKNFAVQLLYEKWCVENEKPIQDPYKSKTFMEYIEGLGCMCSDYAVIMIKE